MVKYTAINLYINRFIFKRDLLLRKNVSGNLNQDEWDWVRLRSPTWRTKIKPTAKEGFRVKRRIYFLFFKDWFHSLIVRWENYFFWFMAIQKDLLKNISPPLGVVHSKHPNSINIPPTLWVWVVEIARMKIWK